MRICVFNGELESAEQLRGLMSRLEVSGEEKKSYEQEALVEPTAPYYGSIRTR